eukprot:CAMPEP_0184491688 /NCGR_PEP_ID=MMETSP0113_2-20130426/21112_1 /TAXON_ID=91329 /ORGANISM="Norrisiella sphaerica, Strain BC52" /LENGTH=705 /DNA_ID=CAMNT_0026876151 /DNA_START=227 /DNA_END=2344 /DNA_ORIENTATION=-
MELVDDHILGFEDSDEEDLLDDELMHALNKSKGVALKRLNWKILAPLLVILIGLLFTFGFYIGHLTDSGRLPKVSQEVEAQVQGERTLRNDLDSLKDKWNAFNQRVESLDVLAERERDLERKLEQEDEELEEERRQRSTLDRHLVDVDAKYAQMQKIIARMKLEQDSASLSEGTIEELENDIEEIRAEVSMLHHIEGVQTREPKSKIAATRQLLDFDLNKFRHDVVEMREMLEKYWKGPKVLENTLLLRPGNEIYEQGINFIADKMARALVHGDKFVIGAMGSSVTAGHDNCNYDSYERQMERLLKPLFGSAKVDFQVRNAGQGGSCGDSFENQIWCTRNILGDDIDVAHYSWTYFEGDAKVVLDAHEKWIRWVLMMERAPVPQFFNTGGKNFEECQNSLDPSNHLTNAYGKFGVNIACLQLGITEVGYPGKRWGAIGDGLHSTTRYGEEEDTLRQRSLGVVFRNWHPGPLGFQVVSDAFAYHYTYALLRAIEMITSHLNSHNGNRATLRDRWRIEPTALTKDDLEEPKYCNAEECGSSNPPGCTNWEVPTYGRGQVLILDPNDEMNPFKGKTNGTGWKNWTGDKRHLIPKEERDLPQCVHLDVCSGIFGDADSGLLTLRLPRMEIGRIVVCSPDGKQSGNHLINNLEIWLEQDKMSNLRQVYGKCVLVQERWEGQVSDSKGHIHLGVSIKEGGESARISHVITL